MNSEMLPSTQLALLLTARFAANGAEPLKPSEYAKFRIWLGSGEDAALQTMQGETDLEGCPVAPDRLQALLGRGMGVFQTLEKWAAAGIWVVSWNDATYPDRYKSFKNRAPVLLFGTGLTELMSKKALAIVGSRNASVERLDAATAVGEKSAEAGIAVVSGGAKGVDAASMNGCLEAGGFVVGVLADSLLRASARRMAREAVEDGRLCLLSEVHPEAGFDPGSAMARNRLVYAASDACLVIECEPGKGGTWSGAVEGLKQEKKIFVLKGAAAERELASKGAIAISLDEASNPVELIDRPVRKSAQPALSLFDD